jgi:hypothetical protein
MIDCVVVSRMLSLCCKKLFEACAGVRSGGAIARRQRFNGVLSPPLSAAHALNHSGSPCSM